MVRPIGSTHTMIEWDGLTGQRIEVTYRVWAHRIDRENIAREQIEIISRRPLPEQFHQTLEPKETKHGT